MAYDGAGSLFALGLRLTKIDPSGAPLVGPENCYTTEALVTLGLGNTYSEPDPIELRNGAGIDDMEFLSDGLTGLYTVDLWIRSVNPYARPAAGSVWSPDLPRARRTTP